MVLNEKAKKYSNIKYFLAFFNSGYMFLLLFLFAGFGYSKALAMALRGALPGESFLLPVFLLSTLVIYAVLDFPLNFYRSFLLEHQFGLTNQKIGDWLKDQAKTGIISFVILLILFSAFYYVLKISPLYWWLIISIFWVFFNLVLAKLVPVVIIPLFFKYKKLSDEALRSRIMGLADKIKIKILDCYEIDFSKKTLKANAAFVGWGNTRRVILADTLKDKFTYDEIEVVLAHEFAHYKLKHLIKLVVINSLASVAAFYLIYATNSYALRFFGFSSLSDIAAFPLVIIYFMLFGLLTGPLENLLSRIMETNADKMALSVTGNKEAFISAMDKLATQNLADRSPHPIIKFFFFDHPSIDERINMAKSQ